MYKTQVHFPVGHVLCGAFLAFVTLAATESRAELMIEPAPSAPPSVSAPAKPAAPAPRMPDFAPGTVRFFLMDGSVLHGKILTPEFVMTTDFGTLKIPAKSVTGLMPGLDSHPRLKAKIRELIDELESGDEQKAARGMAGLTQMGVEILDELIEAQRRIKGEAAQRAIQEVIDNIREGEISEDELESSVPAAPVTALIAEDSISTAKFTAVGRLQPLSIAVSTSFGDVNIKLSEVKKVVSIEAPAVEHFVSSSVTIQQGTQDSFKPTGVTLSQGDRLVIAAKGTIKMMPWDENVSAGPEGDSDSCGFAAPNIPQGALVGRIGSGPVFKIGSKFSIVADRPGTLKIGIGIDPGMWSNIAERMKNGETAETIMPGNFEVRLMHQVKR